MNNPKLRWAQFFAQTEQSVEGADTMNDHRFAELLRNLYLLFESFLLIKNITSTQRIESGFANGVDARVGCLLGKHGKLIGWYCFDSHPRVNPY